MSGAVLTLHMKDQILSSTRMRAGGDTAAFTLKVRKLMPDRVSNSAEDVELVSAGDGISRLATTV